MKKTHRENAEVVLEQPIPFRSPIHPLDRIAVLSHSETRFTAVGADPGLAFVESVLSDMVHEGRMKILGVGADGRPIYTGGNQ
jgi:hypothetical protein